jgi:hypothetical protein
MRANLIYNKDTGVLTVDNKDVEEISLWQEIQLDTASELIIAIEVESDPATDLPEGIE